LLKDTAFIVEGIEDILRDEIGVPSVERGGGKDV
jgi:hypothetical protein